MIKNYIIGGNDLMNNSKTFCPLLFNHLATHPHGGVTHCCIADHRNALSSSNDTTSTGKMFYNLNRHTIKETYNSESFRKARLEVLNGEKPKACLRCYNEEEKNIHSKRLEEIKNYPNFTIDVAQSITDKDGRIDEVQFDFVELRLGNVCNVACRTCNPASSSKWRNDYNELQKELNFKITDYSSMDGFKWPEKQEFWEDLIKSCKNVKTFYINGGEPTLIKQHFYFLNLLADLGKTDVKLWYNINMTNMNEEIIEIWKKFDHVKISCSIDDLGERNEYIRYPTKWETVINNLERLKKEKFKLDITQTVSLMNYSNLDNFYDFFNNKFGIFVSHNYVYDPEFLSPAVLPKKVRDQIHNKISKVLPKDKMTELLNMFDGPDQDEKWKKAIQYLRALDKIRKQNIENYLTEFQEILNEKE